VPKKMSILLILLVVMISLVAYAQKRGKKWEKTVTIPSGEVILDMSGEWDIFVEYYGAFYWLESIKTVTKITQNCTAFTGIRESANKWRPEGTEIIKGELDEKGFKQVFIELNRLETSEPVYDWELCAWEISENGNKISLDCGHCAQSTLTRK
jgi:hypothetical protein